MSPKTPDNVAITSIEFKNYKALRQYSLRLNRMNILVGPNNCGKSTIIGAFRVLSTALRRARGRSPEIVTGPKGKTYGYWIPVDTLPISVENIHSDYADSDTVITFRLSNGNQLVLFFPNEGACCLVLGVEGRRRSNISFRKEFPISVSIVPVLGPLEHQEPLVQPETVQRDQMTHRASRHFRSFWYHFPDGFDKFAELIEQTWPGMQVQRPEVTDVGSRSVRMFCLERRITRELYWAGFGFQVWCQLLSHAVQAADSTVFVIDEPEIYLHADVQRQLVSIIRELGPDIIIATHSTEIMAEADPSEIVLVDKTHRSGERLKTIEGLQNALEKVGSIQNITLARLAKTRKVIFVEDDQDYVLIRRFARQLGLEALASGIDITAVKSGGFSSWEKISALGWGLEKALGEQLHLGAIYDRDFHCANEITNILGELQKTVRLCHVHSRKEIENYLLMPLPLEQALKAAVIERSRRLGEVAPEVADIRSMLCAVTEGYKKDVQSQYVGRRVEYYRKTGQDVSTLVAAAMTEFDSKWQDLDSRLEIVPGKAVLSEIRAMVQDHYNVTLTDYRIIAACKASEIPLDLQELLLKLEVFRCADI